MTFTSDVTLEALVVNDVRFIRAEPLESYQQLIGPPSRSEMPGPPPPFGHRNNVIHFYDHFGLLLSEHHSTRMIDGIEFLFEPQKWYFPTTSAFTGELRVLGSAVGSGMVFAEFAASCKTEFKHHLGHAWYVDGDRISIQFEVNTPKEKGAKKRKRSLISVLCVSFREHDRWAKPSNP